MPKLEGFERVVQQFRDRAKRQPVYTELRVGFAAPYALIVHENLQAHHTTGQAKFLERPMREMASSVAESVRRAVGDGVPLPQALLAEGEKIKAAAQALAPVRTGLLRASAYVKVERTG